MDLPPSTANDADLDALERDGYVLRRGAFGPDRVRALRDGVGRLVQRARAGDCQLTWIDADAGLPDRVSHMLHPDKYDPAWGDWLAEDVIPDLESLLGGPVRHSLFGMLASGGGRGYRLNWHRDLGKPGADGETEYLRRHHGRSIQFNAPIAGADPFLHVVPGSHLRASTPGELAAAAAGVDAAMDGAVEVRLEPGDILYYNANLWHRGWNPEGRLRWTLHAAFWQAGIPVMAHEAGQSAALGAGDHLRRFPAPVRRLVQRYLDTCVEPPPRLQDL